MCPIDVEIVQFIASGALDRLKSFMDGQFRTFVEGVPTHRSAVVNADDYDASIGIREGHDGLLQRLAAHPTLELDQVALVGELVRKLGLREGEGSCAWPRRVEEWFCQTSVPVFGSTTSLT